MTRPAPGHLSAFLRESYVTVRNAAARAGFEVNYDLQGVN